MTHWGRNDLTQPSTGVSNNRLFQSFCVVCQRKDLWRSVGDQALNMESVSPK